MRSPIPRLHRVIPARRTRVAVLVAVITPVASMVMGLPLAASSSATTPPPAPTGWTTVFSDGFTGAAGAAPSASWTRDTGTQYTGAGCTGAFGTGEVENNTGAAANVAQDGSGHLNLTPVKSGTAWSSARIETVASSFAAPAGGELEVTGSIRQPNPATGLGYWPAFWMLGAGFRSSGAGTSGTMTCSNWPGIGEIDIMEDVNGLSEVAGTLHCGVGSGGPCNETTGLGSGLTACSGCQTGFNTYSVIINRTNTSAESISWLLNGTVYHTVTEAQVGTATWQAAVDHGFFILLDVAIGGGFPNAICNCTSPSASTSSGAAMSVANVAVYQLAASGGTTPPPPPPPGCSTTATANISADCDAGSASPITVSAATGDTSPTGVDGNQVAQLSSGNWLKYTGVNFGTAGSTQFDARVASGAAAGVSGLVNVVLDSPTNAPVGSFAVGSTGGWTTWKTIPANITKVTGTHTVYLEFSSGAGGNPPFVSLHYFSFPAM